MYNPSIVNLERVYWMLNYEGPQSSYFPINCFHGSPGTENDFLLLRQKLLRYEINTYVVKSNHSHSYKFSSNFEKKDSILLGYSWGCRGALEFLFHHSHFIKSLILISPYLIHPSRPLLINKTIKDFPLIRRFLLKMITGSIVNNYLTKTSFPSQIPSSYLKNKLLYSTPEVFTRFLYEKIEPQFISYASILREVDKHGIPVLILYGEKDSYIDINANISMIKKIIPYSNVYSIPHSGHALLWTHTNEITEYIADFLNFHTNELSHHYNRIDYSLESFCTVDNAWR
jgi:pimeloyl-ACP methyl ester carboxylesterase